MKGYMGKVLVVDLSSGFIEEKQIEDKVYESLLSGVGLGAYMLYNNIPKGADPLGPDNMLGFTSGMLTGTGSVMTGRWMAVCKSPLTGGWGDSNCGGNLSPAIKQCGYDGIFFKGISDKPVYLHVDNKGAELIDAVDVWGKDAVETEEYLEKLHHVKKKPSVAVIGQAGEQVSLISGIVHDRGRIAARSGVGAVMGSKKLKAIVLAGSKPIKCHNAEAVKALTKEYGDKARASNLPGLFTGALLPVMSKQLDKSDHYSAADGMTNVGIFKKWGTGYNNAMGIPNGDNPIKNWAGSIEDYGKSFYKHVNPDKVKKAEIKKYHCYSCIFGCGGVCDIKKITKGEFSHTHKPEYETVNAFGALLLNKDLDSLFLINELLNRAGMDSISAGGTVAYAIECYENGILTKEDTDGLELSWGNAEAVIALIRKMIIREEGIGALLADGVKVAEKKIGKNSSDFAVHAGGQEPGMHDSRMDPVMGVHFSADPTPGRHTIGSGGMYNLMHLWDYVSWAPEVMSKTPKKDDYVASDMMARKTVANACVKQVVDGIGGCFMAMATGVQHWKIFDYLNEVNDWHYTPDDYMEMGKKMQTLRQMFNVREGIDPISFKMHKRMAGEPPLEAGANAGKTVPILEMMKDHWAYYGWDRETGHPLASTIESLGLNQLLEEGM